jgi:histidine ammonia-lyase
VKTLFLTGADLSLSDLPQVAARQVRVRLAPAARRAIRASRRVVDAAVRRGDRAYGLTTGFGKFADVAVAPGQLQSLQQNLVRSHAAGVGRLLPDGAVRAMIVLRANALARGLSGIRLQTVEKLLAMLDADLLPVVPEQGSVGASGDLAPLAHLALGLTGEGQMRRNGKTLAAARAWRQARLSPATLQAKEGLALVNGVQMSVAVGGLALARALFLSRVADVAGAASLDAARGSDAAFEGRIIEARPHPGAIASAANLRRLIAGSAIRESHRGCGRVQDNYALRCMPQVHGAARDAFAHAEKVLAIEMNSATDNPLVFSRTGDEITLTPIETEHHSPRTFHASRVVIQGVFVQIVRRYLQPRPIGAQKNPQ